MANETSEETWFVRSGESVVGPVSMQLLVRGVEAGKIPPTSEVRRANDETWMPLVTVLARAASASVPDPVEKKPDQPTKASLVSNLRRIPILVWVGVAVLLVIGIGALLRPDRGAVSYQECLTAEKNGDIGMAVYKCKAAVSDCSRFGCKSDAEKKLSELQPKLDAWQKKTAEQGAEQARANADAQAKRIAALRAKVHKKYGDTDPDTDCQGKGLPPYDWFYEGGTYAEDAEVAAADGCRPMFVTNNTEFCCPKKPVTF